MCKSAQDRGTTIARLNDLRFRQFSHSDARSSVDYLHASVEHVVHRRSTVDRRQQITSRVPRNQRRRLLFVRVEASLNRLFAVIFSLNNVAAAMVAPPVVRGRRLYRVVMSTRTTDPSTCQPDQHHFRRDCEVNHDIESTGQQQLRQRLRLVRRSRKTVEDKAATSSIAFRESLGQSCDRRLSK